MRIAVVAPSARFPGDPAAAVRVLEERLAALDPAVEFFVHPQCALTDHHFAGSDAARHAAFVAVANDPAFDAVWFARGGYGAVRIAQDAVAALRPAALDKAYLGYSDSGYLLAGLYRTGFPHVAHGPLAHSAMKPEGQPAARRALAWLKDRDPGAVDANLRAGESHAAFNITVYGLLLGTPLEPNLAGHVLCLEDVAEHGYRTDRAMAHMALQPHLRALAGIRAGRISDVPSNDPDFGSDGAAIVRHWCGVAGIPFLGTADIGHDPDNKVVPFGRL